MKNLLIRIASMILGQCTDKREAVVLVRARISRVGIAKSNGGVFIELDTEVLHFEFTQGDVFCINGFYFRLIMDGLVECIERHKSKPKFKVGQSVYIYKP